MEIGWRELGVVITQPPGKREGFHGDIVCGRDDGLVGWKANEPYGEFCAPNAVLLSSSDGIYLTVCRPIIASPEKPVEIFVYYGDGFEREYDVERYCCKDWKEHSDEDWKCSIEAAAALKVVHGLLAFVRCLEQKV